MGFVIARLQARRRAIAARKALVATLDEQQKAAALAVAIAPAVDEAPSAPPERHARRAR